MTFPLGGFDLIHASPPCQDHTTLKTMHGGHGSGWMLAATIERLRASGADWVVENVPGSEAAMGDHITLCGSSFKLKVRRPPAWPTLDLTTLSPFSQSQTNRTPTRPQR